MADLLQKYYSQVKNPNPVFTPREGAGTLKFCEKLMEKAVGPDRSHFSYNTQRQPPRKPKSSAELKPQSPSLITEKRPHPGPKGRNRVAFDYGCCN